MAAPYSFYPATYQQPMYNPYQQQIGYNLQPTQSNNIVSVRSEDEARNYPVALNTSVTFKDESAPYIYTKTKGAEPFVDAVFTKYKLVREDAKNAPITDDKPQGIDLSLYALKTDMDALQAQLDALREELTKKGKKKDE